MGLTWSPLPSGPTVPAGVNEAPADDQKPMKKTMTVYNGEKKRVYDIKEKPEHGPDLEKPADKQP